MARLTKEEEFKILQQIWGIQNNLCKASSVLEDLEEKFLKRFSKKELEQQSKIYHKVRKVRIGK